MKHDFATQFTGWSFVAAGAMLWAGWMLMPEHIGTYFVPEDFARVRDHLWFWIWMYRVHIFGMVITTIALIAASSLVSESEARVMVWPGAGVATAGMIVSALAAAFYYHHGAWGAIELDGKGTDEIEQFVANLKVDTEYVTCLVRFGRVFSGLGLVVLGIGLAKWRILPIWIGGAAVALGVAAMAITMGLPDRLALYQPVFHLKAIWLVATGIVIIKSGVLLDASRRDAIDRPYA
jgi:hypothetical protein